MTEQTARIRALNDQLRATGEGGDIVITRGIHPLRAEVVIAAIKAVQTFTAFTPENDPHREHDFARIEVCKQQVMFKIDYYNRNLSRHSPDAGDPAVTRRVLTIMLAEEY